MKLVNYLKYLPLLAVFVACSDDDDDNSSAGEMTIAKMVTSDNNLTILSQALSRTGLDETLNGSGTYTVFAPTDAAFSAFLSSNGYASLDAVPEAALREILLNHVVMGNNVSTSLTTGYVKTLAKGTASSSNNLTMYVNTTGGVTLNGGIENKGAKVSTADIDAENGVIHKVNGVIALPTVVNHAIANPEFSSLVAALTRDDQPDFAGILSGTGPFTVFAPNNNAFSSLLTEIGLSQLSDVPQATLENALKYHVVGGANVLSAQLTNNMMVETFQGQSFSVELPQTGAQIRDGNNRTSKIIITDVQAANGVIHVLDKVILPTM